VEAAAHTLTGRPPTSPPGVDFSTAADLDLSRYTAEHVREQVQRALWREYVADERALAELLRADEGARARFRCSVAASRSGLFRDPAQFALLERELLPPLLADGRLLTAWSAECGDGSDLYSLAMLLERLRALERSLLLGTDLLAENIGAAMRGDYGDLSVSPRLRRNVRWELRDLLREGAPRAGWRLVLCRAGAEHLTSPARSALQHILASSLAEAGVLLLGLGERLPDPTSLGLECVGHSAYRRLA
jgi:chemotaxis protein methyltransferase CheR